MPEPLDEKRINGFLRFVDTENSIVIVMDIKPPFPDPRPESGRVELSADLTVSEIVQLYHYLERWLINRKIDMQFNSWPKEDFN